MRIVLAGVETNNKGAELMLYAILQELERRFPKAIVYTLNNISQGRDYIKSDIDLRPNPWPSFAKSHVILLVRKVLRKLHISDKWLTRDVHAIPFTDYYLDASGFAISDVWNETDDYANQFALRIRNYSRIGTKIVFLPQAFGPIELDSTKKMMMAINKYADMVIARDEKSFDYIKRAQVDKVSIKLYPDFTSLVNGVVPDAFKRLEGGICIIPNVRMIDMGAITLADYLKLIASIIRKAEISNKCVFILNHEGKPDEELCNKIKKSFGKEIQIVTGINALEVKGIISKSYLTVSSRFHGVISALNSGVPCLSTSWSHKYSELYKDYGIKNLVMPIDDIDSSVKLFTEYLDPTNNKYLRDQLAKRVGLIKNDTLKMWDEVWGTNNM